MLNNLPEIHALWIGNKLGDISRCCLKSFYLKGHKVFLHTYSTIEDLPDGIICLDANLIIDKKNIFKHTETGSYALFSDLFRYELLKQVDGIYVDCDVYCLHPITKNNNGYIIGYESDNMINGAVLAMPSQSKLLENLLNAAYDSHFIPPWYPKKKQNRLKIKKMFGLSKHISDMPWGVIGPAAITHFIKALNLESQVEPIDVFYPVHYECINLLIDENLEINDITTQRTVCIHLYNEVLRKINLNSIGNNCILSKMLRNQI